MSAAPRQPQRPSMLLLVAVLLFAGAAQALSLPRAANDVAVTASSSNINDSISGATTSANTTDQKRSLLDSARDALERFGVRVQQTGTSVKTTLIDGYNYSVDRIGTAIHSIGSNANNNTANNATDAKSPPLPSPTPISNRESPIATAASELNSIAVEAPKADNDKIVFQDDDGEDFASRMSTSSPPTVATTVTTATTSTTTTTGASQMTTEGAPSDDTEGTTVALDDRIIIDVPVECPAGTKKAADGNCRKVV